MAKRLKDLHRQLKQVENSQSVQKKIDILLELGDYYREKEDYDSAIKQFEDALKLTTQYSTHLDASFACRALCEIYAELNDKKKSLSYCNKFRETAEASKCASQIQLSFHVTAWVYQKLWVLDNAKPKGLLHEARKNVKLSIEYIKVNGFMIDKDHKAVQSGGDSRKRKAHAERLYSSVAACLGLRIEAEQAWNNAFAYAQRNHDAELKYELLLAKIDFNWLNESVATAQKLLNHAPPKKKALALLELSQAYIFERNFSEAQKILWECLSKYEMQLIEDDKDVLHNRIVFLHKYFAWKKKAESPTSELTVKMKCYENIADSLIYYSDDRHELRWMAIEYYEKMLGCTVNDEQRMPAYLSLAETLKEVGKYERSLMYFEKNYEIEKSRYSNEKLLESKCAMFVVKCMGNLRTQDKLIGEFDDLMRVIPDNLPYLKKAICQSLGEMIQKQGGFDNKYIEQAREYENIPSQSSVNDEIEEQEEERNIENVIDFDNCEIILESKQRARKMNDEKELIADKDKIINSHGETRLHVAARNADRAFLQRLISYGYNVNAVDFGGWTPLHEAIGVGDRKNVITLLKAKANVNAQSKETFEEDDESTGGGITPLMDACLNGYFEIAKDLIMYGADVFIKNEIGWTVLEFLRTSMVNFSDDDCIASAEKLISEIETMFREKGIQFSKQTPSKKRKNRMTHQKAPGKNRRELSPAKENLNEYKATIGMFSSTDNRRSSSTNDLYCDLPSPDISDHLRSKHRKSNEYVPSCSPLGDLNRESPYSTTPNFPRSFSSNFDSHLDDGESRKRRSAGSFPRADKRQKLSRHLSSPINLIEEDFGNAFDQDVSNSPELIQQQSFRRFSSGSFTGTTQKSDFSNNTQRSGNNSCQPTTLVTVHFKDCNGDDAHPKTKMKFSALDNSSAISVRCREILVNQSNTRGREILHHQNFKIMTMDGCEVDSTVSIADINPPEFVCQLLPSTSEMLLKASGVSNDDVLNKLRYFDENGVLDISDIEIANIQKDFISAIKQSSKKISALVMDYYGGCEENFDIFDSISPDIEIFKAFASNITTNFLVSLSRQNVLSKLTTVILSLTRISCGKSLSMFLSSQQLTTIELSGLQLLTGVPELIDNLSNNNHLKKLDLSYSPWLTSEHIISLLSRSNNLLELELNGNNLSGVQFEAMWLPTLKRLSLVGCNIEYWDSLFEWVPMGLLEFLDVSTTDLQIHHIQSVLLSRSEGSTSLSIRAVRCKNIDGKSEELVKILLEYVHTIAKPQLEFSRTTQIELRKRSLFVDHFLVDNLYT